jgi:hypothetical protein
LWLGNDAAVLGLWLERLRIAGDDGDAGIAGAPPRGAASPKLSAFARPRELFDSGRLHPDADVNERVRTLLSDLRQYRTLHVTASTRSRERQIDVAGTLLLF